MNELKGKWDEIIKLANEKWDKLDIEELQNLNFDMNKLKQNVEEKYDMETNELEKQFNEFKGYIKKNVLDDKTLIKLKAKDKWEDISETAKIMEMEAEDKLEDASDTAKIVGMEAEDKLEKTAKKAVESADKLLDKGKKGLNNLKKKLNK